VNKACEVIQEALSAYLDHELTGDRLEVLEEHLASCQGCKKIAEDYHTVGRLLREEITSETAKIDLGNLREKIQEEIAISARLRQWVKAHRGSRRYVWSVASALGLAMAVAIMWFGPWVWNTREQAEPVVLHTTIQEQLGLAIRDAAGVKYSVRQVAAVHQEELGQLIREYISLSMLQSASSNGPNRLKMGKVQEQMGVLIRDHSRSRWVMHQKSGQIQERLGTLIQDQARQQTKLGASLT